MNIQDTLGTGDTELRGLSSLCGCLQLLHWFI